MTLLTGCTLGPSQRPPLATFGPAAPAADTTSSTTTPPVGPGGPGQRADPIRWQACGDVDSVAGGVSFQVDCGSVFADRSTGSTSGSQTIQLARARAPGVPANAPTIVVIDGEPGQNGRDRVAAVAAGLSPGIRDHFAVITLDLAGTGRSGRVDCLSADNAATVTSLGVDPTEPAAAAALATLAKSLTFECGDLAGPDLSLINSSSAADDLDAVRSALGQSTLALIGRGFGATLGAVYADRYPGRVGAAVLDAPADPLDDLSARAAAIAVAAEKSLDAFAARCPDFDGGCPLGADPRAQVQKAVSVLDDAAGAPGTGRTNGGSVLLTLLLRLGDSAGWPALPPAATGSPSAGCWTHRSAWTSPLAG